MVNDVDQFKEEISGLLKKNIAYEKILSRNLSGPELERAKRIKTNLRPIQKRTLDPIN